MTSLTDVRRRFANEIANRTHLQTDALVPALAIVPREAFLPPGPWTVVGEETGGGAQATPNADPCHVYKNVSIALDAQRQLFNGAPSAVLPLLDALGLRTGDRVFHVGCGSGYYTALLATVVGPTSQLHAVEVDPAIAIQANRNLREYKSVVVEQGDGTTLPGGRLDAILVHAGVTHPLEIWLDALVIGGCPRAATRWPRTGCLLPAARAGLVLPQLKGNRYDPDRRRLGWRRKIRRIL